MENYKIIEKLSEGSSGVVYNAKHLLSDDTVALKKIRLRKIEEGLPKTAIREIITTRQLEHPNIVQLREVFAHTSSVILIYEFMHADLHDLMKNLIHPLTLG